MLEMVHVVNGITTMAFDCPSDGNVSVDFSVHNEKIVSARSSKSSDMVLGGQQVSRKRFMPLNQNSLTGLLMTFRTLGSSSELLKFLWALHMVKLRIIHLFLNILLMLTF